MANNVIEMNPSKIGKVEAGTMTVLAPKEFFSYQNREELEGAFDECMNQNKTKIILDFKNIAFIDSEGLELLVQVDENLRNRGGVLKIVGLNDVCRDIFVSTRLINTFNVFDDVHEAIRSTP